MKITDVRTASVRETFEWILVRVYTDEGLVGLGECYWGAGVETVVHRLKELLVGEDPHNIDWLFQKMVRGMSGAGSTGGTVVTAISGVELALWDLKGRALGTPIYNLLGGQYRDKIKIYLDMGRATAQRARRVGRARPGGQGRRLPCPQVRHHLPARPAPARPRPARACAGAGMAGQYQLPRSHIDLMVSLMGAVRDAVGPDIELALDCHWSYTVRDALILAAGAGAPAAEVAGGPDAAGQRRGPQARHRPLPGAHLLRREPLHPPRLPRDDRDAGGGHHPARHPQGGRAAGGQEDRRHGGRLLHPHGGAQRLEPHRHRGRLPRLRRDAQLPDHGVPLPRT